LRLPPLIPIEAPLVPFRELSRVAQAPFALQGFHSRRLVRPCQFALCPDFSPGALACDFCRSTAALLVSDLPSFLNCDLQVAGSLTIFLRGCRLHACFHLSNSTPKILPPPPKGSCQCDNKCLPGTTCRPLSFLSLPRTPPTRKRNAWSVRPPPPFRFHVD